MKSVFLARLGLALFRRTPQGVRGLKSLVCQEIPGAVGRTPQGVRGLKSHAHARGHARDCVAPRKGCVD